MRSPLGRCFFLSLFSLPSIALAANPPSLRTLVQAAHPHFDELITLSGELDARFARLRSTPSRSELLRGFTGQSLSSSFREPQFARISDLEGWPLYREQVIDADRPELAFVETSAQAAFKKTVLGQIVDRGFDSHSDDVQVSSTLETFNGKRYQLSHLSVHVKVTDYSRAIAGYDKRGFYLRHDILVAAAWWWRRAEGEARTRDMFLKIYGVQTMEELRSITTNVGQITALVRARDCADLLRDYFLAPAAPSR